MTTIISKSGTFIPPLSIFIIWLLVTFVILSDIIISNISLFLSMQSSYPHIRLYTIRISLCRLLLSPYRILVLLSRSINCYYYNCHYDSRTQYAQNYPKRNQIWWCLQLTLMIYHLISWIANSTMSCRHTLIAIVRASSCHSLIVLKVSRKRSTPIIAQCSCCYGITPASSANCARCTGKTWSRTLRSNLEPRIVISR